MISIDDILLLHERSIKDYGGSKGVRDLGLFESSIARPFQTFAGNDLYNDALKKATALVESLIINHPFVDGNKRIGALAMIAFLKESNYYLTASSEKLYEFIISISTGEIKLMQFLFGLKKTQRKFNSPLLLAADLYSRSIRRFLLQKDLLLHQ